ncbi:hypothetical protein [Sulfuricurvum sp.]|uniref:hypothetical protein n=1 Tax=Sulfuricurvum sp. TaxID=2025608 RepID=UPI002E322EDD|nr:hypothetical protein [Sulfuricurvum sp.]HEX5330319.1 hypothetical protein [Sulfuricurvum sp.]
MLRRFSFVYMLVFGILLWIVAGIAIFGIAIWQQYSIVQLTDKLYEHPFIANNAARDIRVSSRTAWEYANQIIYHDALNQESLNKIHEFELKTKENFITLQRSYLGDPQDIRNIYSDFISLREVYLDAVALVQQGEVEKGRTYIETHEGLKRYYQLSDDVNKVIFNTQESAIEYKAEAVSKVHSGMNLLLLLSAISIIIGSIASFFLVRYLNQEFHILKDFARKIETGEFGQMGDLQSIFSEFRELKLTLNIMSQSLKKSDQEIRDAYNQTQSMNTELEESYRHLKEMQSQLVESEKMASVGKEA